jgi:hypothetical protein
MAVDPSRAKSLFLRASDIADPAERAAFLDHECGDSGELRARVEALLRAEALPPPLAGTDEPTEDPGLGQPGTGEAAPAADADRVPRAPPPRCTSRLPGCAS